jgi:hypothetical protein
MKKKKPHLDPVMSTAMLFILLEKLHIIALIPHHNMFPFLDDVPETAIPGMTTESGSLYYTAEKIV